VSVEDIFLGVVIFGPPFIVVAILVLLVLRRKARLSRRDRIPFQEWAGRLGIRSGRPFSVCEKVLKALGKELGVDPGQLRPNDFFDADLALAPPWVGIPNPHVKDFLNEVAQILWEEGVPNWTRYNPRGKTLGDLLVHVDAALTERRET
jgi:hypothetical protein